jgi:hypothetical protein
MSDNAQGPVPKSAPVMQAWEAYKRTEGFENTRAWVGVAEHTEGALWAAFVEGWKAAGAKVWPDAFLTPPIEGVVKVKVT